MKDSAPVTDKELLIQRIDALLALDPPKGDLPGIAACVNERLHGTLTVLALTHGSAGVQTQTLLQEVDQTRRDHRQPAFPLLERVWPATAGILRSLRAEVEAGLTTSIRMLAIGESVADHLELAKAALRDSSDGAKNVAAVLVAAAYEDTIRRMGTALAGVLGRPHLQDVVGGLRERGLLRGASATTAQGFLKFRNDALHADWDNVDRAVIGSCMAFTERLLAEHFS